MEKRISQMHFYKNTYEASTSRTTKNNHYKTLFRYWRFQSQTLFQR